MENNHSQEKKSNKNGIIIAILIIIILVQAIKIFIDYQDKKNINKKLEATEKILGTTTSNLNQIRSELTQKIEEIEKLGGNVTELQRAKTEVEQELKKVQRRSGVSISDLNKKIEGYRQLLLAKDEEIKQLKSNNSELFNQVTVLKMAQSSLQDSLQKVETVKQGLAERVSLASRLRAEDVQIASIGQKNKERKSPFKNRHLETLKVSFKLGDNKVAAIGNKKIFLRLVNQEGQEIYDVEKGSGTFTIDGKEHFFAQEQDILFDNSGQSVTFLYKKQNDLPAGKYVAELYESGQLIGEQKFIVK